MAKNKQEQDQGQKVDELAALQAKVKQLEDEKAERDRVALNQGNGGYAQELQVIQKKNSRGAGNIAYKDIHDHVNIPLYHTNGLHIGKVVGPIHPGNALDVYQRFEGVGVKLSIYKPTAEQVERYKATKEWQDASVKFQQKRKLKDKSKKESEVERLTREIAKMSGVSPDKINRIKDRSEVNSASAQ